MADYIVKDDGTATGDDGRYVSEQTGSFATLGIANYYASITAAEAATTTPVAGDRVLFSDQHAFNQGAGINFGIPGVQYICVDDANMDAARTSNNKGSESVTDTSSDINMDDMFISGISFTAADNISFKGSSHLIDSEVNVSGASDVAMISLEDGTHLTLTKTTINVDNASSVAMQVSGGASIDMFGGEILTTTGGVTALSSGGFGNGGGALGLFGVNIAAITGTLIANVGSNATADDRIDVRMDDCDLASGVDFTNETFKSYNHRALFTRCSDSSALAEHQYHLHAFGGDVDDDSTIRRADDDAFEDSGTIVSYKIVTNSDASLTTPLWLDFPNPRWAELSSGATDTLRFHIASTVALTDKDIYVEVVYPDGTNKQTPNFATSAPTTVGGTIDLMATGTTLTTDSGSDWRDGGSALTGHNEYQIDVDTSGDVGADTVPIVRVYITKANVTIQLGSTMEQVA